MQALFGRPGRGMMQFAGDTYQGQLTEGTITSLGFFQFIGTHAGADEEVVYQATKAFWEGLDEVHATALFLQNVTPETAFTAINVPLHPGALRYYEEAGYDIPEELRPYRIACPAPASGAGLPRRTAERAYYDGSDQQRSRPAYPWPDRPHFYAPRGRCVFHSGRDCPLQFRH